MNIQFYKKIDLKLPYDHISSDIFWDWGGDDIVYTSNSWDNKSNKILKIGLSKLSDESKRVYFEIDYSKLNINKLYLSDLSYNFKDSVIAIVHNRGLIFYEINSKELTCLISNKDTSFTEVFYHHPSNSFIAHSLYFYNPNDVENPEKLYNVTYDVNTNVYHVIEKKIKFPYLPYSILVQNVLSVDSLVVLSNVFDNSFCIFNSVFDTLLVNRFGKNYTPPYNVDSIHVYRKFNPKLIFQKIKSYDYFMERIEKIFTVGSLILTSIKPVSISDFSERKFLVFKFEDNQLDLVTSFDLKYNKKINLFNLYNFTVSEKIILKKGMIALPFINLENDFKVINYGNKIKINNFRKWFKVEEESTNSGYTYSIYISRLKFASSEQ